MDPLNAQEYLSVVRLLKKKERVDPTSRFQLITLEESPKDQVLKWKPGGELTRKAFVIIKNGENTFEAVVDITNEKILSWESIKGVQPAILLTEDWLSAQKIVRSNPEWQEAIRKRGINNFEDVVCIPHTVGYHGLSEEEGRRLVKVTCYDSRGTKNFWGRPIEGLIAVVDHNKRELIKLIDNGNLPIPKSRVDFDEKSVGSLRVPTNTISVEQPEGPSFKLRGNEVAWQKWKFHFRIDPRLGPVVSLVRYMDNGQSRSILYQGSVSELFIPYMDPDVGWYFRTYMDAGEYGLGKLATSLKPGLDCPENAVLFDTDFVNEWGGPYTLMGVVCLFERYSGNIAWRHYEAVKNQNEARKEIELVLRFISAVGSYDYIFDWVFRQDGTIKVAVGSTGISQVKAVKSRTKADDKDGYDTAYGRMVSDNTVGINHDHFFSFRLDLDVDGKNNSFIIERLKQDKPKEESPRKSIWIVETKRASSEHDAKLSINLEKPALWRVINPNVSGPLGYPTSYQLKPKTNAISLLDPQDYPQRRAGFTDFHLWVTPYNPREKYAAGIYPNQSKGGEGLPDWTKANRSIVNTDIVLWYTLGFHHVVRAEDWPVVPTKWDEFDIRPFDFFKRNPALDIPK